MLPAPVALPRRRRRQRRGRAGVGTAPAGPASGSAGMEFDDSRADRVVAAPSSLAVVHPQGVAPPVDGDAAVRGRRPLVARRSGSRSPRRASPSGAASSAASAAAASPPVLLAGRVATIQGLVSRPELDHVLVDLKKFDASAGRWICSTQGGEQLRILPEKLKPIEETHQKFSRLRYEAG